MDEFEGGGGVRGDGEVEFGVWRERGKLGGRIEGACGIVTAGGGDGVG